MCGAPASTFGFVDPGVLHTASLSGLAPGREYWYQVGDQVRPCCAGWSAGDGGERTRQPHAGCRTPIRCSAHAEQRLMFRVPHLTLQDAGSWSPVFSFRAPPLAGPGESVHILALADQGVGEVGRLGLAGASSGGLGDGMACAAGGSRGKGPARARLLAELVQYDATGTFLNLFAGGWQLCSDGVQASCRRGGADGGGWAGGRAGRRPLQPGAACRRPGVRAGELQGGQWWGRAVAVGYAMHRWE